MINTYKKGSNVRISLHFSSNEFDCPCSNCLSTLVDSELIQKLEAIREKIKTALKINSGYRCANYQTELRLRGYETSAGPSQHELGRAADIMSSDAGYSGPLEPLAIEAGFLAIGVGHGWVHVDLRADKVRRWTYTR